MNKYNVEAELLWGDMKYVGADLYAIEVRKYGGAQITPISDEPHIICRVYKITMGGEPMMSLIGGGIMPDASGEKAEEVSIKKYKKHFKKILQEARAKVADERLGGE